MATPRGSVGPVVRTIFTRLPRLTKLIGRLVSDLEITGSAPPGPAVVAANHFSHLDPVLAGTALKRFTRYLAVDELYGRSRVFDGLTLGLGAIPLSRERAPLGALKLALETLDAGDLVCLFPEGRRVREWGEQPPRRGAAWLSLRSGAPLVPMAISGTEIIWPVDATRLRRGPVRIWIGEGLQPDRYLDRVDPIGAMMADWHAWMDERLTWASSAGSGTVSP